SSRTTAPFTFSLVATALANGTHALTARAFDAAGRTGTSSPVMINVLNVVTDTELPQTQITSPVGTVRVNSTVTIVANATDNVGVTRVDILVSGTLQCTRTAPPFSCPFKVPAKAGKTFTLQSRAFDAAGNVG